MTDREKVIDGLERCAQHSYRCLDCPYEYFGVMCTDNLAQDALELLKEQEPKLVRYTESTVRCPSCNKQITTKGCIHREIKYCWKCGQAVKWDE